MSQMQRETLRKLNNFLINYNISRVNFLWINLTKSEVWYAIFLKRLTFLQVLIHLLFMLLRKYYIFLYAFLDIYYIFFVIVWFYF